MTANNASTNSCMAIHDFVVSGSGSIGFRGAAKDITFSAEARKTSRPDHRETFPFQKDQ